ncbi:hypothetical protein RND71_009586 [Anisodus tanguticus]|uniref:Uncharacterized protein n=1 Tax=Anisodus tanguticus TaxID=243964 RepID=A0AAE1SI39_9SOLA|nr:hypothetical protein RND71_009586 [Anisodus tanguticus]
MGSSNILERLKEDLSTLGSQTDPIFHGYFLKKVRRGSRIVSGVVLRIDHRFSAPSFGFHSIKNLKRQETNNKSGIIVTVIVGFGKIFKIHFIVVFGTQMMVKWEHDLEIVDHRCWTTFVTTP